MYANWKRIVVVYILNSKIIGIIISVVGSDPIYFIVYCTAFLEYLFIQNSYKNLTKTDENIVYLLYGYSFSNKLMVVTENENYVM